MSGFLSRWYSKEVFAEIDFQSALAVYENAKENNKNSILPGVIGSAEPGAWLRRLSPSKSEADIPAMAAEGPPVETPTVSATPRTFYQIIVRKPISSVGTPFDPEKFKDASFIDEIKESAVNLMIENAGIFENTAVFNALKNNAYVPYNFYIDPGSADSGSLIYFQVLFSLGSGEYAAIVEASIQDSLPDADADENNEETSSTDEAETKVSYFLVELAFSQNSDNMLLKIINTIESLEEKNRNLTEKWDFSFMGLAAELKHFYNFINETFYGSFAPPPARQELWNRWDSLMSQRPTHLQRFSSESVMTPQERIEFTFATGGTNQDISSAAATAGANSLLGAATPIGISPVTPEIAAAAISDAMNTDVTNITVLIPTPDMQSQIVSTYYRASSFNEKYGSEVKYILKKAKEVDGYIYLKNQSGVEIDDFVNRFINPVPKKLDAPTTATAVYNSGEANYKTREDRQSEVLTDAQKEQIFVEMMQRFNQDSDQIFLDIIMESAGEIKTSDEVFKYILDRIPVQSMVAAAAQCLLKYIPQFNLKEWVCDAILKNISPPDVDYLIEYLNYNASFLPDSEIKTLLLDIPNGVYQTKNEIKLQLQAIFGGDITSKDVLCAAVFAVIPAALEMLESLENLDLSKLGPPVIDNPFAGVIDKIKNELEKYKNMALNANWSGMIKALIARLIQEVIVQTVSLILDQIRQTCEGSNKADFANLPVDSGQIPGYNPTTNPFNPATVDEALNDPSAYDDIAEDLGIRTDPPIDLVSLLEDFLRDLGKILTLSELCVLLSSAARRNVNQRNLTLIVDKVWDGILSTEKYLPLKKALGDKSNLRKLFFLLSKKVDQSYCVNKLKALDNTKKLLSELCAPASNQALIEDLSDKASDAAIQDLLKQDDDINRSIVDAIANLQNPNASVPPLFCGPDAEESSFNKPLFETQSDPSQKYLNNLSQDKAMRGVERAFEKDIIKYKSILTNADGDDQFAKIQEATQQVASIMAGLYGSDNIKGITAYDKDLADANTSPIMENNKIVANKVYASLIDANSSIKVDNVTDSDFVQISAPATGGDVVNLKINFANSTQNEVPARTTRMSFGILATQRYDSNIEFFDPDSMPGDILKGLINDDIAQDFSNLLYNPFLLQDVETKGTRFYSVIINQIVREHAEYIATKNLFFRELFDLLKIEKENPYEASLLNYKEILAQISENVKLMECLINFYDVPNANDICQINAYVELIVKTVVIKEFLRSLMVFSVYGIDALLPDSEDLTKPLNDQNPYYQYVIGQINNKLNFGDISSDKSIKCSDWLDSTAFRKIVYDYSSVIYAAKQEGQPTKEQIGDSQTFINLTLQEMVIRHFASVQKQFFENNKSLLGQQGILQSELEAVQSDNNLGSPSGASQQILRNILATNEQGNIQFFDPPPFLEFNFSSLNDKVVTIPPGFYSSNERLENGGFFLERGFEVSRKRKGDPGVFTDDDLQVMKQYMSAEQEDDFLTPDPNDQTQGGLKYKYISEFNQVLFGNINIQDAAYKKDLSELFASPDLIGSFSQWEGKLPFSKRNVFRDILQSIRNKNTAFQKLGIVSVSPVSGVEVNSSFHDSLVNEPNKFFKKFNNYLSLNLLMPVTQQGTEENFLQEVYDKFKEMTNPPGFRPSFIETAWEKKYFIREGTGKLYLKIPLLTFYDDKSGSESIAFAETTTDKSLEDLWFISNSDLYWTAGTSEDPGFESNAVIQVSEDERFRDFVRFIEYKALLSFIAILVSELIEKHYPKIEGMFDDTLDVLVTALNTLLSVSNRNNDPNFYQVPSINPDSPEASGLDFDLMSLVFNLLIKMLANMSDPTWKTPWFVPGPLTPFGIIAKILEAIEEDGSSDASSAAAAGIAAKQAEIQDKECSDEGNS